MASPPEIHVIAGALSDTEGRVLIAQRPRGRHMAGRWEFPGGKLAPGEDSCDGLKRELAEELGVIVREARPLIRLRHDYPDRRVLLEVCELMGIEPRQAIAVGDGANDLPMMGVAGLSIAFHPKPAVAERAMIAINSGGLDRALEVLQV